MPSYISDTNLWLRFVQVVHSSTYDFPNTDCDYLLIHASWDGSNDDIFDVRVTVRESKIFGLRVTSCEKDAIARKAQTSRALLLKAFALSKNLIHVHFEIACLISSNESWSLMNGKGTSEEGDVSSCTPFITLLVTNCVIFSSCERPLVPVGGGGAL